MPVLAKTKAHVGRLWTYVRDDRPFAGPAPPAALFRYSRDRRAEHPVAHLTGYGGILQADAYAGYNTLFRSDRSPSPVTRALCWAHARRKFFELGDVAAQLKRRKGASVISPIAAEAVRRIDEIFDAERAVNGNTIAERLAMRQEIAIPLVTDLEQWLRSQRAALARHNPVAGAIDYMLKDWPAFVRFLDDGRICLTNNAAERALRGVALGRKAWLFAGSDRGGERRVHLHADLHRQAQRHLSASLARRCPRLHCRHPAEPALRTATLELATTSRTAQGRVNAVLTGCLRCCESKGQAARATTS